MLVEPDLEKQMDTEKTNARMNFSEALRTIGFSDVSTEISFFLNTETNIWSTFMRQVNMYIIFDQYNRKLLSSIRSALAMIEENDIPYKEYRSQLILDENMNTNRKKQKNQGSQLLVNIKHFVSATHLQPSIINIQIIAMTFLLILPEYNENALISSPLKTLKIKRCHLNNNKYDPTSIFQTAHYSNIKNYRL